ncbi:hypothetical protein B0H14DRAFT_3593998 [Mycena olivaceomarginata]|nr:hypothetical protein B0H14DRAFT_3593998 [Mycena olivaceomarginata]
MFGCCVAGRLLQTNLQQVDETHALFELPNAGAINHVCVFLLGTVPFPDGYGCTVHFYWPGKGFQLLGMLSNDKPPRSSASAGASRRSRPRPRRTPPSPPRPRPPAWACRRHARGGGGDCDPRARGRAAPRHCGAARRAPGRARSTRVAPLRDPTLLAERVVKHLFNYVSGFTGGSVGADVVVPMG